MTDTNQVVALADLPVDEREIVILYRQAGAGQRQQIIRSLKDLTAAEKSGSNTPQTGR